MLLTAFCAVIPSAALAASNASVGTPSDTHVNVSADYSASADAGLLETITRAVFTFPSNTDVSGATVTGDGNPTCTADNGAHTVTVDCTALYLLGGTFNVTVHGIANASAPGSYAATVTITGVGSSTGSRNYTLASNASAPGVGPVQLDDWSEWAVTTTTVPVRVGANGRLSTTAEPGGVPTPNRIVVDFPAGYTVPSNPAASSVTVEGATLDAAPVVSGRQVSIAIPSGISIAPNTTATVVFLPSFGMANPDSGSYAISAHTDAEAGSGTSASYSIGSVPTTLTVASANSPSGTWVTRNQSLVVDGFTLQRNPSSRSVNVGAVTVTDSGDAPSSNVSGVSIYRDNGDNVLGAGDTLLNASPATFSGADTLVTFDAAEPVTTVALQYWVVYEISPLASDGAHVRAALTAVDTDADHLDDNAVAGAIFTVDAAPPTIAITSPAASSVALTGTIPPYTIAGSATDAASGVSAVGVKIQRASDGQWFNGIGWQVAETTLTPATSDGWATWSLSWPFTPAVQNGETTYTITAVATDNSSASAQSVRSDIRIDTVAPSVASAASSDATHVDVIFSEAVDPASVDPGDFAIAGLSVSAATVQPDGATVRLTTDAQTPEQGYNVAVTAGSVLDTGGNPVEAPLSAAFTGSGAEVMIVSADQPAAAWARGGTDHAVDGFTLAKVAGSLSVTATSVTIEDTNTATSADVSGVSVYRDTNADGVFGAGDTLLNAVPATFSGFDATVAFDSPEAIAAATQYFVVYHFAVGATDGRIATSKVVALASNATLLVNQTVRGDEFTIDTLAPAQPVASASTVSTTAIDVSWGAVVDSTSGLAEYAVRRAGSGSLVATTTGTTYRVNSLTPGTEYGFYVEASDNAGNVSASDVTSATTFDVVAPVTTLSFPAPDGEDGWWTTTPRVTFTTNEPAVAYYSFTSATGPWTTWLGSVTVTEGLSTLYYYAEDSHNNAEEVRSQAFKVDTLAPSQPTLSASSLSTSALDLTWDAATDAGSGFSHYALRTASGSLIATGVATSYHVSGLTPSTAYGYYLQAIDAAGNVSRSTTLWLRTLGSAAAGAQITPPHVATNVDTDVCAMCHRDHTSASRITASGDSTMNALLVGQSDGTTGDASLCYACHGAGTLGSNTDVQDQFRPTSGHRLAPTTSAFGPKHKQCSDCHDPHGSAKTASGLPYPSLLRSKDASGNLHMSGDAYCAACHTARAGSLFPGLATWRQTAHARIATPTTGTDIVCSVCHAPHGSTIAPSIRTTLTPPAVAVETSVPANDRRLCEGCHARGERSWDGPDTYAVSGHGSSAATVAATGHWVAADETSTPISRRVGECQSCHDPMGVSDGSGGVVPRMLSTAGENLCLKCHKASGVAAGDFASLVQPSTGSADSLVAAYSATSDTRDYGRVHVFSRVSTSSPALEGPREFVRGGQVGAMDTGDIDGDGQSEVVLTKPGSAKLIVLSNSKLKGLAKQEFSVLAGGSFLAIGKVFDNVADLPDVVVASSDTVRVYHWNGVGFDIVAAHSVTGQITGLAVGRVLAGSLAQVVVTTDQSPLTDSFFVLHAEGADLTEVGEYAAREGACGPSIGDFDADGIGDIAMANAGLVSPVFSVYSGAGAEVAVAGSANDASATATCIGDFLNGDAGAEVAVTLAAPQGAARLEVFPRSGAGFGAPATHAFDPCSNPGALASGDIDDDGRLELAVGLSGLLSSNSSLATPPGAAIVHQSADGTDIGPVDLRTGGGVELAGGTSVAIANLGTIGRSRHPIEAAQSSHSSSETVGLPEHVACPDCHNVHASTDESSSAPVLPGVLNGASGVSVRNTAPDTVRLTQRDSVAREYEVCLKCHSAWADGGATSIASQINTQGASFHPIEGPGPSTHAVGSTFVGSLTALSQIYCIDCHGDSNETEPAGPHVSDDAPLLVKPTLGVRSTNANGLCFKCHRYDLYATGAFDGLPGSSSGFWGGNLPVGERALHASHTQGGFACASCHVSHGSPDLPYLLRSTLGWESVAGGGACTNGCHGGTRHEYTR